MNHPIDLYWLKQTEADLPAENDWLSANEALHLKGLRFAKRRADWLLGRWTAKCALAARLDAPAYPRVLAKLEIRPAASGAPEVFWAGKSAAVTISLSHRSGAALCVVAEAGVQLGCDLELIEPRSDAFVADYFTNEEQKLLTRMPSADRPRMLALLWSGKESALKALHEGMRLDTRCVVVAPEARLGDVRGWSPLTVCYSRYQDFHGWWRQADDMVLAVVADPPPEAPILLENPPRVLEGLIQCA
ncbi:MAG TPA: 4'-phosphopantetheinyl transferase superfamily protein [Terriglobales bacterium]|nr:4'-phosphopantetheinyl transferase superfamily protein [Terriglobales bacterium]